MKITRSTKCSVKFDERIDKSTGVTRAVWFSLVFFIVATIIVMLYVYEIASSDKILPEKIISQVISAEEINAEIGKITQEEVAAKIKAKKTGCLDSPPRQKIIRWNDTAKEYQTTYVY